MNTVVELFDIKELERKNQLLSAVSLLVAYRKLKAKVSHSYYAERCIGKDTENVVCITTIL